MESLRSLCGSEISEFRAFGDPGFTGNTSVSVFFGNKKLILTVDPDTDSLSFTITFYSNMGVIGDLEERAVDGLSQFLDMPLAFIWAMENQKGYFDAMQLMFSPPKGKFKILQFMAVASEIVLFDLTRIK